MADVTLQKRADALARRWEALADRKRRHLLELYRSGRWKLYYSEEQLLEKMRSAVRDIEAWQHLAEHESPAIAPEGRREGA